MCININTHTHTYKYNPMTNWKHIYNSHHGSKANFLSVKSNYKFIKISNNSIFKCMKNIIGTQKKSKIKCFLSL